jgi:hypothetical protein
MRRTIKLATATLALLLTASIVAIIAYDRGSASPHARTLTYNLSVGAQAAAGTGEIRSDLTVQPEAPRYRVHTTAKTALDLGQNRNGCAPSGAIPPEATCEIALAFPDIGLHGTVTIVGSDRSSSSNDTLTFELDD